MDKKLLIFVIFLGLLSGWLSTSGSKSQFIRLLDILLIGPLMIYFGTDIYKYEILKYLIVYFGSTTITYNLKNFLVIRKIGG